MTENSLTSMAPLLLRKLITSLFISADNSLLNLAEKYKLLQFLRHLLVHSFLLCLRILPSLFPSLNHPSSLKPPLKGDLLTPVKGADSSIARALAQLLSIMNEIPVSSRKYEVVRSLAEKLIDDNLQGGFQVLREVNRSVISAAFSRSLVELDATVLKLDRERERERADAVDATRPLDYGVIRVLRAVRSFRQVARSRLGGSWAAEEASTRPGGSAEKLASELLWLAQRLADCECAEEAVWRWGSASSLAWLALSAESRLQGLLVRITAFLFKQAKEIVEGEDGKEGKKEEVREMRMKILMSWLPLLCHASRGADAPVLNRSERVELERVLEETIEMLEREEQEKVLALWLHHFTISSSSDWPNLQACYGRWYSASRKMLLVQ
ncbi:hypothetical protein HHK36_009497 [Tetracentron sinense]|uniref:Uncharacterized protein n=1 Tax=Tetracentron sinense TaxID=13715 RepID=A0A834ZFC4_TETSI|nr:hypothetical protein HHK36_009497 [Tetracentron sinense]